MEGTTMEGVIVEEAHQMEDLQEVAVAAAVAEVLPVKEGATVVPRGVEGAEILQVDLEAEVLEGEMVLVMLVPALLPLRLPLVGLPLSEALLEAQEPRVQVRLRPRGPLAILVRVLLVETIPTRILQARLP